MKQRNTLYKLHTLCIFASLFYEQPLNTMQKASGVCLMAVSPGLELLPKYFLTMP